MEIRFQGVDVERAGNLAVRKATGTLPHGSWTGLIGANGSGKTSLLRALAGRLPLASGKVEFPGQEGSSHRIWRATNVAFAPEISALPQGLTGRQYLGLIQRKYAANKPDERLDDLRKALGFDSFIDRQIATLSAGMRQRIAVYSAFADSAETVILDEPFNYLDPICAYEVKEALRSLVTHQGFTLVTALHEIATLIVYCDQGLLMGGGTVVRLFSIEDLRRGTKDIAAFEASVIQHLRSSS